MFILVQHSSAFGIIARHIVKAINCVHGRRCRCRRPTTLDLVACFSRLMREEIHLYRIFLFEPSKSEHNNIEINARRKLRSEVLPPF